MTSSPAKPALARRTAPPRRPDSPLRACPDFPRTVQRFEAWWLGQVLDRPPVSMWLGPNSPYTGPVSAHATVRDRWLDAQFAVEQAAAALATRSYIGDSFPMFWPNIGPEITATLFGCELEFSQSTSWSRPIVHDPLEWERVAAAEPDFDNPYWRAIERMTEYALQICEDRFVVGITDLHGNYDILAALRDPEVLATDMIDCPELVRAAGWRVAQAFVEAFRHSYAKVAAGGFGSTTWCPAYHCGPAYLPSCDFWCMVSPEMARGMILPDIRTEIAPLERSLFHLDGPQALRHLDLLLELPELTAVQWVFGAGNGPASKWLDVYRRCLAAGKSVQAFAHDRREALHLIEQLGPEGLWLTITGEVPTPADGEALLADVARTSARFAGKGAYRARSQA